MENLSLKSKKVGFIGAGHMAQALASALLSAKSVPPENILISNRTEKKLQRVCAELGVVPAATNEELVDRCDIVVIAVKPQDLVAAVEPISSSFHDEQIIISLAAGITLSSLKKIIPQAKRLVRLMANTPVSIHQGVIGYCMAKDDPGASSVVEDLFQSAGLVVKVEEGEEFEALMVSTSSGIGFVFELMQYWQEWLEEHNFSAQQARDMTVQTFLGASLLAKNKQATALEELQNKVTSKKGVTASGLGSMRELEVERLLRYSFEKAVLRDRELGKDSV